MLAVLSSGASASAQDASQRQGYINQLPEESGEARQTRHARVAERRSRTVIMVHRGASHFAPENTLEAFAAAMDHGADGCEIDIRATADGILYLMHDDAVDRTLKGQGSERALTYYDLLGMPVRGSGESTRVPTLAALLELARQRAMLLHLDVKEPGLQDRIIQLLTEADMWDHVVECNAGNAERVRNNPRAKLLRYKGWYPEGEAAERREVVEGFMSQPGEMVS